MLELGLNPDNGSKGAKRSDARRLNDQMHRFFNAIISFQGDGEQDGRALTARRNMLVADDIVFWWDTKNPNQTTLWGSYVELGQRFYEAITAAPVPVDVRALRSLKSLRPWPSISIRGSPTRLTGQARQESRVSRHGNNC